MKIPIVPRLRIAEGVMIWLQTCVEQAKGRKKAKSTSVAELPSIEEFIVIRRIAVTGSMALGTFYFTENTLA